jgi:hypothetical protein
VIHPYFSGNPTVASLGRQHIQVQTPVVHPQVRFVGAEDLHHMDSETAVS